MPVASSPDQDRRRLLLLGAMLPCLASCSAVGAFNALVPVDQQSRKAASDIAFGPDPRQRLDVYTPDAPGSRRPVVLFIYGGSWRDGSRSDYEFVGHALASQGFVTMVADYRLVPQFRFPAFVEDAALATKWTKANARSYGGDPEKLFIMGHSAGAYNAAMAALDTRFVRAVGLERQPYRGFIGLAGPYAFLPFDANATRNAFGDWPNPSETQPVSVATKSAPPSFLATGVDDTTVRPRNTKRLAEVLKKQGTPVVVREYPGIGHAAIVTALSLPFRDRAPVLADVSAFIRKHDRS